MSSIGGEIAKVMELAMAIVGRFQELQVVKNIHAVEKFLRENATIRVCIPNSPASGHQSNTVTIVRRLIGFGLQGKSEHATVEIVFQNTTREHEDRSNLQKLMSLLPEINSSDPYAIFYVAGVGVKLYPVEDFEKPFYGPERPFGITGGFDDNNVDLARFLNVRYCLRLQPFQWRDGDNGIWDLKKGFVNFDKLPRLGSRSILLQPYYAEFPEISGKDWELLKTKFPAKVDAVKLLYDYLPKNTFNMMPIYGINEIGNQIPTLKGCTQSQIVFNLISGIRAAQRIDAAPANKGALVVMISTLTQTQKGVLRDLFAKQAAEIPDCPKLTQYVNAFIRGSVEFISFDDEGLREKLDWLGTTKAKNNVVILELGPVTSAFFQHFYQVCTLPSVFEGQGTMVFSINVGKPFIKLNQTLWPLDTTFPSVQLQENFAEPPQVTCQIVSLSATLTSFRLWEFILSGSKNTEESGFDLVTDVFLDRINGTRRLPSSLISQLIIEGFRPDFPIADYFSALGEFSHDIQNDKLILTMAYTVQKYFSSLSKFAAAQSGIGA